MLCRAIYVPYIFYPVVQCLWLLLRLGYIMNSLESKNTCIYSCTTYTKEMPFKALPRKQNIGTGPTSFQYKIYFDVGMMDVQESKSFTGPGQIMRQILLGKNTVPQ